MRLSLRLHTAHCTSDAAPQDTIRRITYVRSVVTPATVQAAHALSKCQGRGGVYYAGAYTLDQVPLQEQAVRSGVKVQLVLAKLSIRV
jgi:predicted NAD/FAD-binding protein